MSARVLGVDWRTERPEWDTTSLGLSGLWVGSETCVHDLPTPKRLRAWMETANGGGLSIALLLPCFTQANRKAVLSIAEVFLREGGKEIVVNDINGIALFHEMGVPFSLGRVSLDVNVDPRLRNSKDPAVHKMYGEYGFNTKTLAQYRELGCRRVYCSALSPIPESLTASIGLEVGVIGPGIYLTEILLCPFAKENRNRGRRSLRLPSRCDGNCTNHPPLAFQGDDGQRYSLFRNGVYYATHQPASLFEQEGRISSVVQWPPVSRREEVWFAT